MKNTVGSVQASLLTPASSECATIQRHLDDMLSQIDRLCAVSAIEDDVPMPGDSREKTKLTTLMRMVESGLTQLDQAAARSKRGKGMQAS